MQSDKEILPAKYFAEDDTMRSIGNYPEYVGTMMICIDSLENGVAQGRLHSYYLKDPIPFFSLDQLLFALDDVMDQAGTPQAWTEKGRLQKQKTNVKRSRRKKRRLRAFLHIMIFKQYAPKVVVLPVSIFVCIHGYTPVCRESL